MKRKLILLSVLCIFSLTIIAQKQIDRLNPGSRDDMMIFNLSALDWIGAFDSLHAIMEERYPYTEWKGIEWDQKYFLTHPEIQEAQNEADTVKLTEAMFEYLYSIPDGHVMLRGDVDAFRQARQAGSFGLNMIPVTSGKIVANIVPETGTAYLAGLRCGDEILTWNGTPILQVPGMEVYNNFGGLSTNYATSDGRLISRYEILSRDSIGAEVSITYISHETGAQHTVTLTAESDDFALMHQAYFLTISMPDFDSVVTYEILEEHIGYLRVLHEGSDAETLEEIRQDPIYLEVKEAISYFQANNVDKLVFDLRFNAGGNDLLGSAISGFFTEIPAFYEYITGTSDINYAIIDSIITEPEAPYFSGEVVVMVGPNNISTGEGIPMILQRLPNARVVSFWGTNGSFGIVPNIVIMPDSIQFILFPYARSLDENQVIQLDSDSTLAGGVQPDVKIPLTVERVIEQWGEGKDVELEYAISTLLDIPENLQQKRFKIYPNPASSTFYIQSSSEKPITILITDVSGRLVRQIEHYIAGQVIDVSDLKAGLYFVSINSSQLYQVEKLLVH